MAEPLYFDWNATTPLADEARAAMVDALASAWANPASVHRAGRAARDVVEGAREAVARLVGVDARDVWLTSGGTEANNMVLRWAAQRTPELKAPGLVVGPFEHPSVLQTAHALAGEGVGLAIAQPCGSGLVSAASVVDAIGRLRAAGFIPRMASVQTANHETGVINPIAEISEVARRAGVLLHTDAVQAIGKIGREHWAAADFVTVASHKIRGPKGIGALTAPPRTKLVSILRGGAQERGVRPGTQDPIAAAGFGAAAQRACSGPERYADLARLRDHLEESLLQLDTEARRNPSEDVGRLPHVLNLSWPGWLGPELCAALDLLGVCVSSGSACSAGTSDPSPVIVAMLGERRARGAVRISMGDSTTEAMVDRLIAAWKSAISNA